MKTSAVMCQSYSVLAKMRIKEIGKFAMKLFFDSYNKPLLSTTTD